MRSLLLLCGALACNGPEALSADRQPLVANFKTGLPSGWSVANGTAGADVIETPDGIYFPPKPPNMPKGSIRSPVFTTVPGAMWIFSVTTKGTGGGGGLVEWADANGKALGAMPFAQAPSIALATQTQSLVAPAGAASGTVLFWVDTFGSRLLSEFSISSGPAN